MEYRYLGKSGLQISELSFGSWITFGNQIDDSISTRLMEVAYDHGVNFFDNAETYADGKSEIVMGNILSKLKWDRTSYLISSKAFFGDGGKLPNQTGLSRKHLVEACHAALRRLQVDYLDLYFCHRPDKKTPMHEVVWTMNHLIQQGKILYWGTSEWSALEIMEAHAVAEKYGLIGPVMEQPQYNLFHRQKVEVDYSKLYSTVGLGTTIWSPLASGLLTNKYLDKFPEGTRLGRKELDWLKASAISEERIEMARKLNALALEIDYTLPQLAVQWCRSNPNVSTVILGASKTSQLEENLATIDKPALTQEIIDKIEAIVDNKPVAPQW